jgi:hypothetical protein
MDRKNKIKIIACLLCLLGVLCSFASTLNGSVPYPIGFTYYIKDFNIVSDHSCEAFKFDISNFHYGYKSMSCDKNTQIHFLNLDRSVTYTYWISVANGGAKMYITLFFRENIIGNQNLRDARYSLYVTFFPSFYEVYSGEGSEGQKEFVLKVTNWFEKNWLKDYEWEKKTK